MEVQYEREGREIDPKDIPAQRNRVSNIYEEVREHYEAGKRTALAYYRANANLVTKLRAMGLQAASRRISLEQAKKHGLPYGTRGAFEIVVRYTPELSGGSPAAPSRKAVKVAQADKKVKR